MHHLMSVNKLRLSACTAQNVSFNFPDRSLMIHRLLVGKPEGRRPLGRPRRRWIDNNKTDLLEIGLSVMDWIGLAQDRYRWRALVNAVLNLRVP
jgi:hypothetical protein